MDTGRHMVTWFDDRTCCFQVYHTESAKVASSMVDFLRTAEFIYCLEWRLAGVQIETY